MQHFLVLLDNKCANETEHIRNKLQSVTFPLSSFKLALSRMARKEHNFMLATRLIHEQMDELEKSLSLEQNVINTVHVMGENLEETENSMIYMRAKEFSSKMSSLYFNLTNKARSSMLELELETSKLLKYMNKDKLEGLELLTSLIKNNVQILMGTNLQSSLRSNPNLNEACSNSILKLIKWLSADTNTLKEVHKQLNSFNLQPESVFETQSKLDSLTRNLNSLLNVRNYCELNGFKFNLSNG
jgi:hypothetical protein